MPASAEALVHGVGDTVRATAVGPARATALPSLHASALSRGVTADYPSVIVLTADLGVVCLCRDG